MIEQKYIDFFKNPDNIKLLNDGDFITLYREFQSQLGYLNVRELTSFLYLSGINVLDYVDKVPDNFIYGALVEEKYPFLTEDFHIREGIKEIGFQAFKHCKVIKRFFLPSTLTKIEENALCPINLREIYYNGTKRDWQLKVEKENNWTKTNKLERLIFTDDIVELN